MKNVSVKIPFAKFDLRAEYDEIQKSKEYHLQPPTHATVGGIVSHDNFPSICIDFNQSFIVSHTHAYTHTSIQFTRKEPSLAQWCSITAEETGPPGTFASDPNPQLHGNWQICCAFPSGCPFARSFLWFNVCDCDRSVWNIPRKIQNTGYLPYHWCESFGTAVVVVHSRFVLQSSHFVGILWAHSAKRIDTFSVLLLLLRLIHSTIRGGIQPRLVNLHKKSVHRGALSRDISHPFGKPFIYLLPCRGITENIPLFLQWLSVCGHLRGGVQLRKLQKGTAATANSDRGHEAVVQKEHRSANSNRIIRFCRTYPWPIAGN